jgi:RNA polymerase sigma-70 factor (ECF subfamily)
MLTRVKQQDVARIYREYGYLVFRRCVLYLGDATAAREATREVFARVLRNESSFRAFSDARTWLCRVTDVLCVDTLRASRARGHNAVSSDADSLEASISDDDQDSHLLARRLLATLEPDSLRLAVLFYVDELTEEELAQELGLSRRVVARRVSELLAHARSLSVQRNAS